MITRQRGTKGAKRAHPDTNYLRREVFRWAFGTGRGAHYLLAPKQDINPTNPTFPKQDINATSSNLTQGRTTVTRLEAPVKKKFTPPPAVSTGQVTGQVTPPVAVGNLLRLLSSKGTLGNSDLLKAFGLRDRTHLREHYVDPALAEGLVERTLPEKPTSRLQKYRLTAKGRAVLASQAPNA